MAMADGGDLIISRRGLEGVRRRQEIDRLIRKYGLSRHTGDAGSGQGQRRIEK